MIEGRGFACKELYIFGVFFLVSVFAFLETHGQTNNVWSRINNSTICYGVLQTGAKLQNSSLTIPVFYIRVDKNSGDSLLIEKLTVGDWIAALSDPNTDWAANLLLYERYKRNAMAFIKYKRAGWEQNLKEYDITFWQKELLGR